MTAEQQDDFYRQHGSNIHTDPERFQTIADICLGSVLDIGCGTGDLADYYDGPYVGIDQSEVAIEMAKQVSRKNTTFIVGNAFEMLEKKSINSDTVVMAEFLEHLKDWDKYCQKLISKMQNGRRIIISVPNGDRIPDDDHIKEFTVPMLRKWFSFYGRVQFHNYGGFSGRILMSVDLGVKINKQISLGMFCKNEGKGLETAILSCINFVDEIVIMVDDSSNDDTLKIAERYADIAKPFEWQDSFCKARELVQQFITCPWVLILDGHEFVTQSVGLNDMLKFDGDGLMIKMVLEEGFTFDFPRIIRRYVKWEFDVHNNAKCKKTKMFSNFVIQHDRNNLQTKEAAEIRTKQRTEMMQRKLKEEIKKNKKNNRPYFYLGELHFSLKNFKLAKKYWKKYLKYSDNNQERWLVKYQIAGCYINQSLYPFALRWLKKAEKEIPGRWEVAKARGLTYLFLNDYQLAVNCLVESLKGPKEKTIYSPLQFDLFDTWDKIASCFRRLNLPQEAITALRQALKHTKSVKNTKNIEQRIKIIKEFTSQ